jgi:DMSO reductase anchor subunit
MHPAYSVIFFTTATGAGYGLAALLGLLAAFGLVPLNFWFGMVGFGLAFSLIGAGLLSSTGHLGHPERAWRAFSQWRSSWLSREGVAAVASFVPMGLLALGWVFLGRTNAWIMAAGLLTVVAAAITVSMTAMIYASLKPIAQWHSRYTLPGYLLYAVTSGLVLLNAIMHVFGQASFAWQAAAVALTLASWGWKRATWQYNDSVGMASDLNAATGLTGGSVRSVEWPHTEENYLLKEMGFRIARKHSEKLRSMVQMLAFALPIVLLACAFITTGMAGGIVAAVLSILAVASQLSGLLVERWLFFAEAKHTVTLYYGSVA